ncbi:MAG: glycosyltransferase family 2 protein [Candidatus Moranbacteria bacterium]|nr:glycosyltransferase family 2 protein [Candidatus Moranbacteria bacterium]
MEKTAKYSIVVPVFNEDQVLEEFHMRITSVMQSVHESYELIFINDGSQDRSSAIIESLHEKDETVKLLSFSRNFGHQVAITAGMDCSSGQAVIVIDSDLQDPPEVILEMIKKWKEGHDVVYGKRIRRKERSLFKKTTAAIFYRVLRSITDSDIPVDVGDFRLIDRRVCDVMKGFTEKNRYVRGLVSWVGFRQAAVEYERDERFAGKTKYSLGKMMKFAIDAATSFSHKPLKMASYLGVFFSGVSFVYLLVVLYERVFTEKTVVGWTSIVAVNLFFNGIVLIILGAIGEYIGRIYDESKNRPLYIIESKKGFGDESIGR